MNGHGFWNTSSPKLTVPQVSEQESGWASSTCRRCSNGSVTAPPVLSCTTRLVASRSACTVSRSTVGSRVGWASRSRTCTWIRPAPAASQARPVSTSSSSVTGSAGTSALALSAPVGATVIRVRAELMRASSHDPWGWGADRDDLAADGCSTPGPNLPMPSLSRLGESTARRLVTCSPQVVERGATVPEGALLTGTIEPALLDLAAQSATGCLVVRDPEGDEAEVYLRDGQVYAVAVPGRRTMLGVRLMSRGALTPEALSEALEIQRTELQGWRLGELLVHLGYVDLEVVEEFVVEHLKDALADLLGWPVAAWKFRKNKKTRQDVAPPTPVASLLRDLHDRATTWETILAATGGPDAVPTLASGAPSDQVALGPNEWALLCKVDDARTVADLAGECGFTLFEAGQVVMRLREG